MKIISEAKKNIRRLNEVILNKNLINFFIEFISKTLLKFPLKSKWLLLVVVLVNQLNESH